MRLLREERARLKKWADALTESEMRLLVQELVVELMDSEQVTFGDLAPYWRASGDPLVQGQEPWE